MAYEMDICRLSGRQTTLMVVASLLLGVSFITLEFRLSHEDVTSVFVAGFVMFWCLIYAPLACYVIWIGEKSISAKKMETAYIKTLTQEKYLLLTYATVIVRFIAPFGIIGCFSFALAILYLAAFPWADSIEDAAKVAPLWWMLWAFGSDLAAIATTTCLCIKAFWQMHCLLCMHYGRFIDFINQADTVCWDGLRASLHGAQNLTSRLLNPREAGATVLVILPGGFLFMAFGFVLLLIEPVQSMLFAIGVSMFVAGFVNFFMPLFVLADVTSKTKRVCEAAEQFECRAIAQIDSAAPLDSQCGLQMELMRPEERDAHARFKEYVSSNRVGLVLLGIRIEKDFVWTFGMRVLVSVGTLVPVVHRIFHSETATFEKI